MALLNTRQSLMFEDAFPAGFNLGMGPDAFRNLGINIPAEPDGGIMSLPGANTTVANRRVADDLANQAAVANAVEKTTVPTIPATEIPGAREVVDSGQTATQVAAQTIPGQLYGFDTSGFKSGAGLEDVYQQFLGRTGDIEGLRHWVKEIGTTVEGDELARFLEAAAPERERVSKLTTPDVVSVKDLYSQALGRANVSPEELTYWQRQFGRDISPAEIERFLASAKPELETTKFDPFSAAPDTSLYPKFEGRAYNPAAYENLVEQLSGQQKKLEEKGFKYGSTFGGAQETIDDIAKRLASMGISNIYDLGMKHELPVEKIYETIEQDEGPPLQFDTGKYRTISGVKGRGPEGEMIYEYRELTPDEVKKLKFDKSGVGFLPIGMADRESLLNTPFATTKYYNKKTGEELDTRKIGGKAESGLFASSGAGDGYTNYRVMYAGDGTPVIIPEKNLSGMKEFIAEDLSGILSVLRFIPGAQLPVMLAQLAAGAYMGAKPEDLLKQAAVSLVSSNMDKILPTALQQVGILDKPVWDDYLGKFVGGTPTSELGKLALKAGSSGLASLVQSGGDLEQALKSSGIALLGDQISGLIPKGDIAGINYSKLFDIFAPSIARGELTNADVFRFISSLAQEEAKKKKPPSGG